MTESNESWTWQPPLQAQSLKRKKHSDAESLSGSLDSDEDDSGRYSKYFRFSTRVLTALQKDSEAQGQPYPLLFPFSPMKS